CDTTSRRAHLHEVVRVEGETDTFLRDVHLTSTDIASGRHDISGMQVAHVCDSAVVGALNDAGDDRVCLFEGATSLADKGVCQLGGVRERSHCALTHHIDVHLDRAEHARKQVKHIGQHVN